jgi:Tfp pilus assembly protein PilF
MGDLEQVPAQLSRAGPLGSSIPAKMRVAIAYAGRGESARAEEILRSILDVHPESDGVRRVLALLLEKTGRPEEAQVLRASDARL